MKTFISTYILSLALASPAFAQTAYETLRDAFGNSSNVGAKIEDFETENWTACLLATVTNPTATQSTSVRILEYNDLTDNGPLFPGNGNLRIDVFNDRTLDQRLASFFQYSTIKETPEVLVQTLQGSNWNSVNIFGKKQGSLLLFAVEIADYRQGQPTPKVYGYCWNRDEENADVPLPVPN